MFADVYLVHGNRANLKVFLADEDYEISLECCNSQGAVSILTLNRALASKIVLEQVLTLSALE